MTMDKSLRVRKGGTAVRGVLTRAERIGKLKEQERWQDGRSPIGLPKVRVPKLSMKVDLPTPGTPVMPMRWAAPVRGMMSASRARASA